MLSLVNREIMHLTSYTILNTTNTIFVAIFVFDTQVTGQRNIMIESRGKVAKRKGMNSTKYSITKMDIKTEMRTTFYL